MVYSKRIAIFAVKQTKRQENRLDLRFVFSFCKSLTSLCQILALCLGYICYGRRMIYLSTIFPTIFSAS